MAGMASRLRWKKALPFDQVPLVLNPLLNNSLQQLIDNCSVNHVVAPGSIVPAACESFCWPYFSPLSFFYVINDLIHRGGINDPAALINNFISRLRPVFVKNFETCRAWMEHRPVWRVNVRLPVSSAQQQMLNDYLMDSTLLRLVLSPTKDCFFCGLSTAVAKPRHCIAHPTCWSSSFASASLRGRP